jgi:hypothetical protein
MRYNRRLRNFDGDKRRRKIFLIFPLRLKIEPESAIYETRWLEYATVAERYRLTYDYGSCWDKLHWID